MLSLHPPLGRQPTHAIARPHSAAIKRHNSPLPLGLDVESRLRKQKLEFLERNRPVPWGPAEHARLDVKISRSEASRLFLGRSESRQRRTVSVEPLHQLAGFGMRINSRNIVASVGISGWRVALKDPGAQLIQLIAYVGAASGVRLSVAIHST